MTASRFKVILSDDLTKGPPIPSPRIVKLYITRSNSIELRGRDFNRAIRYYSGFRYCQNTLDSLSELD